jgi:hypothetical protein
VCILASTSWHYCAAATGVVALGVALLYPYGSDGWRVIAFGLCLCSFGIALWPVFPWQQASKHWLILPIAVAAPSFFICTTRQVSDELVSARFHGRVAKIYRSHNHQYPALDVADESGKTVTMEALPDRSWGALHVGDAVQKEALDMCFNRGNERLPVIEPSFLHTLRGAKSY